MVYQIKNKKLIVKVNSLGAEITSVIDRESKKELMWQGSDKYWDRQSIIPFPFCGRFQDKIYTFDEQEYKSDIHGFAKDSEFELVSQSKTKITLFLKDNEQIDKIYPFKFNLFVIFSLVGKTVNVNFKILNKDNKTMYFSIGGHPGFNVPFKSNHSFEKYYLTFKRKYYEQINFVKGLVIDLKTPFILENRRLDLNHELFKDDAIFLYDKNDKVTIRNQYNKSKIQVKFKNKICLGIWQSYSKDTPFLCIEPWNGVPGRSNIIEDLKSKPNTLSLDANKVFKDSFKIKFDMK